MQRRFLYRANALAVGGRISSPDPAVIESQASVVLPITGGRASARCAAFRQGNLIAFDGATSEVVGSQPLPDGAHETVSQVAITGLDIGSGMVTADRVVARLVSRHPGDGSKPREETSRKEGDPDEADVFPLGSSFINLRIAGRAVQYEDLTPLFTKHPTFDGVRSAYASDREFVAVAKRDFLWSGAPADAPAVVAEEIGWYAQFKPPEPPTSHGTILAAIVGNVRVEGLESCGNLVIVPGFGRVYLGELVIQKDSKRLTMLRLNLGSPEKGTIVVSAAETNGHDYP